MPPIDPPADTSARQAAAWGVVATVLLGLLVELVFDSVQIAVVLGHAGGNVASGAALHDTLRALQGDGSVVAAGSWVGTLVCVPLLVGLARLKTRAPLREYFALVPVPARVLVRWLLPLGAVLLAVDLCSLWLGRPLVHEWMHGIQQSADPAWLLLLALVVAAPLFEEMFFRGFLYRGLAASAAGPNMAIAVTSLAWAAVHLQYGAYEITWLFVLGVLLGVARKRTGSLWTPLLMHAVANLGAWVEALLLG